MILISARQNYTCRLAGALVTSITVLFLTPEEHKVQHSALLAHVPRVMPILLFAPRVALKARKSYNHVWSNRFELKSSFSSVSAINACMLLKGTFNGTQNWLKTVYIALHYFLCSTVLLRFNQFHYQLGDFFTNISICTILELVPQWLWALELI